MPCSVRACSLLTAGLVLTCSSAAARFRYDMRLLVKHVAQCGALLPDHWLCLDSLAVARAAFNKTGGVPVPDERRKGRKRTHFRGLGDLGYHFGLLPDEDLHRARPDALLTHDVLLELLPVIQAAHAKAAQQSFMPSWEDLLSMRFSWTNKSGGKVKDLEVSFSVDCLLQDITSKKTVRAACLSTHIRVTRLFAHDVSSASIP